MAYRLLVSDVDGTLVDGNQQIVPRNLEAIKRFQRAGGLVTLGTGRIERSAWPYLSTIGVNAPAILYNGGRVVDYPSGEVLAEDRLPPAVATVLVDLLETVFTGLDAILYSDGQPHVRALNQVLEQSARKDGLVYQPVGSLTTLVGRSFNKALIIGEDRALGALDHALRELAPPESVTTVRSESTYLEVLPPGVSKGSALRRLAAHLGISLSEVIAIGDNLNDLEMVRLAGLGVAVANAHPALKQAAACVCRASNEEAAVAEVIERFCLA